MKTTEIKIMNFRGIDDIKLEGFGDINIFTGRNNAGKSTCLEAIALLTSGANNFVDNFSKDLLTQIISKRNTSPDMWKYLMKDHDQPIFIGSKCQRGLGITEETVIISDSVEEFSHLVDNEIVNTLRIKEKNYLEEKYGSSIASRRLQEKTPTIKNRLYFLYDGLGLSVSELIEFRFHNTAKISVNDSTLKSDGGVIFIQGFQTEETLHDILAKEGKLHATIKRISEKIPDFVDLRNIENTLSVSFMNKPFLPLSMMGDGFKVAILTTLYAQSLKNGTLILEEPENYLHPGLMLYLVDELVLSAKKQNMQLFLSTHNDELIRYFLERSGELQVKIIQMNNTDGKIQAKYFDKDQALKEINELGFDLRGF